MLTVKYAKLITNKTYANIDHSVLLMNDSLLKIGFYFSKSSPVRFFLLIMLKINILDTKTVIKIAVIGTAPNESMFSNPMMLNKLFSVPIEIPISIYETLLSALASNLSTV